MLVPVFGEKAPSPRVTPIPDEFDFSPPAADEIALSRGWAGVGIDGTNQTLHEGGGAESLTAGHPAGGVGDLGVEGVGDALFHVFILYLFIHTRQPVPAGGENLFRREAGEAAAVEGADL